MTRFFSTLIILISSTINLFAEDIIHSDFTAKPNAKISASLHLNPRFNIEKMASPLAGQLLIRDKDLQDPLFKELAISRTWVPHVPLVAHANELKTDSTPYFSWLSENYRGWESLPHKKIRIQRAKDTVIADVIDGLGAAHTIKAIVGYPERTTLMSSHKGLHNYQGSQPSALMDPRNIRIMAWPTKSRIEVHLPGGHIRYYDVLDPKQPDVLILKKEVLPNGKALKYLFSNSGTLNAIQLVDVREKSLYQTYVCQVDQNNQNFSIRSQRNEALNFRLLMSSRGTASRTKTQRGHIVSPSSVGEIETPQGKKTFNYDPLFLIKTMQLPDQTWSFKYKAHGESILLSTLTNVNHPQKSYTIAYNQFETDSQKYDETIVSFADKTKVVYVFNSDCLIVAKKRYSTSGKLHSAETFTWDEHQYLKTHAKCNKNNQITYKVEYSYDKRGNPIEEVRYGNFTDQGSLDSFTIRRYYSQDGRDLLIRETHEDGRQYLYTYLPHTNLVVSKLTKSRGRIVARSFYTYDSSCNLIEEQHDNGYALDKEYGSASHFVMHQYTRSDNPSALQAVSAKKTWYSRNGKKVHDKTTFYQYNSKGLLQSRKVKNQQDQTLYSEAYTYTNDGQVSSKTIGDKHQTSYQYNDRETIITNPSKTKVITTKDSIGRVISTRKVGYDKNETFLNIKYDDLQHTVTSTDHMGYQKITYCDPITNKPIKVIYPDKETYGKVENVCETYELDEHGNILTHTDLSGKTTRFTYNAYHSPLRIDYPDKTFEKYTYFSNGLLKSFRDREGSVTHNAYNSVGMLIGQRIYSKDKHLIMNKSFKNVFGKTQEVSFDGARQTQKIYDGLGRIIENMQGSAKTTYEYDALSRRTAINKHLENDVQRIEFSYDSQGNVIEKTIKDKSGQLHFKERYQYDNDNNQTHVICFYNNAPQTSLRRFNSLGDLVEEVDANHNKTTHTYSTLWNKATRQRVLCRKTLKPDKTEVETVYNGSLLPEVISVYSNKNKIYTERLFYNVCNQLIRHEKNSLVGSNDFYCSVRLYEYDLNGHLKETKLLDQVEPKHQKSFEYSPLGLLKKVTKANGVTITYEYDHQKRLAMIKSSDKTVHTTFQHTADTVTAVNHIDNNTTVRLLDDSSNVIKESYYLHNSGFLNSSKPLTISALRDRLNRVIRLELPHEKCITYTYDASRLKKAALMSLLGSEQYSHAFSNYDLAMVAKSENLPFNIGTMTIEHDPKGKPRFLDAPGFIQVAQYNESGLHRSIETDGIATLYKFDALGNIQKETSPDYYNTYSFDSLGNCVEHNKSSMSYDSCNQLTSFGESLYEHDEVGNMTHSRKAKHQLSIQYDALNRVKLITHGKKRLRLSYDGFGRVLTELIEEQIHSKSQWFNETWAIESKKINLHFQESLLARYDDKLNTDFMALRTPPEYYKSRVLGIERGPFFYSVIHDIRGHVRSMQRQPSLFSYKETYTTDSFGTLYNKSTCPFQFKDFMSYPGLGLLRNGTRFYMPSLKRWIHQSDDLTDTQMNPYVYAQ